MTVSYSHLVLEILFVILVVTALGFIVVCNVLGIVTQWKATGPFRALTYGGFIVLWALYDEIRSVGWRRAVFGYSKAEFADMQRQGWPSASDDPNITKV